MKYDRLILGYHGCTAADARIILSGNSFHQSENDYDWLGAGIYFWERGPDRALRFIQQKLKRKKSHAKPAVVGALIQLGTCFDLLDTHNTRGLRATYQRFVRAMESANVPIPTNAGAAPDHKLRRLDCAVLNYYLAQSPHYQTVRGCFHEGAEAFPGSGIRTEAHIQIAVRDPACIIGTFRPTMIKS
ncbi:MAG: hypothetical protein GXP55_18155 [Deltaproteobacteria bacterium]|nr:hypothetical protein [Deltaproteobacteria bacterium]